MRNRSAAESVIYWPVRSQLVSLLPSLLKKSNSPHLESIFFLVLCQEKSGVSEHYVFFLYVEEEDASDIGVVAPTTLDE